MTKDNYAHGLMEGLFGKLGKLPLMKKLAAVRRQLRHMSLKRMNMHLGQIHTETGVPRIVIFADMVWCELRYGIGYLDYHVFGFAKKHGKIRNTYMTARHNHELTLKMNDSKYYSLMNDKCRFDREFKKYLQRDFLVLEDSTVEDLRDFCSGKKAVFAKATNKCGGEGIQKIDITDSLDYQRLYNRLAANGQGLLEDAIIQHHEMNRLNPDSVNTLRIVTLYTKDGPKVAYILLRMGRLGKCVDNVSSGGMYLTVKSDGTLKSPAFCDKTGEYYTHHPDTGTEFEGFKVPCFEKAVQMAFDMAEDVKDHLKYVGWDICIAENDPCVVEGNILPGYDMCQNARHTECGMVPHFESLLGYKIL